MRRLRKWWWALPLLALAVLASAAVVMHLRTGCIPFGRADQETRVPDATGQAENRGPLADATRPPEERFTFKTAREGERIVLSGFISGEEVRSALLEAARQIVPNAIVTDELKTSDKVPPGLDEAAAFALRQLLRLPSGTAAVDDGMISLGGQAPDTETYNTLTASPSIPAGFRLDLAGLVPPLVRPYTWTATSSEAAIALAGHVPSEAARRAAVAAARQAFPEKQLVDRLQPASGVPHNLDFDATVRFALTQLAQLRAGAADLVDVRLNFRGDATDRETLAVVRAALQSGPPPGLHAGSVAITLSKPSPYTFRARRDAGVLTLTGYYPNTETRAAIQHLIGERFLTEQVVDRLRPADGAPQNYLAGVSFGLEHLSRLASGEVAVSGTSLRLSGEALYPQTAEQTMRTLAALSLRGWSGKAEVTLRPPEKADAAQLRSPQP
jgi:hypothetical protein